MRGPQGCVLRVWIANDGEKLDVIMENNVAVCCALAIDSLKDSKSFDLREAWYSAEDGNVVLRIGANNSYGNTVVNYWLFIYSHEDDEWEWTEPYLISKVKYVVSNVVNAVILVVRVIM